jgi:hypothetical protein
MDIQQDYDLYQKGMDYNNKLRPSYYKTIDVNERFYAGDHWHNVKANGQPTLIMPVYKRIADHEIASILSSPVKAKFSIENYDEEAAGMDQELKRKVDMLNFKLEDKWEKDKLDTLLRECLIDGFNTGDYAIYTYWDSRISTKQYSGINPDGSKSEILGDFVNEVKDGAEIMFGNPNDRRVQTQPYILVIGRDMVSNLKAEAKANKVSEAEYSKITGDQDFNEQSGDRGKIELDSVDSSDSGKCLYIIKLWKKEGQVFYRKSTKYCMIIKEQSMGLKRYPLAWGNWTKRKNSYHGTAPGTAIVPNQVAINQMYSNVAYNMRMTAFGKVLYDSNRIEAWDNRIGAAIPMNGDVTGAVFQLEPGKLNTNIFSFMNDMLKNTKDLNGANDVALGDINPEQASGTAIAATAQQSAIPLDNPKENLYQFIEDLVLNWQDFIESKYTVNRKVGYEEDGVSKVGEINGEDYKEIPMSLKIDVGPSKQWSEITSVNTIMNLLNSKEITLLQALERFPDGYITDKEGLISQIKEQQQMQSPMDDGLTPEEQATLSQLPPEQQQAVMEQLKGQFSQTPQM